MAGRSRTSSRWGGFRGGAGVAPRPKDDRDHLSFTETTFLCVNFWGACLVGKERLRKGWGWRWGAWGSPEKTVTPATLEVQQMCTRKPSGNQQGTCGSLAGVCGGEPDKHCLPAQEGRRRPASPEGGAGLWAPAGISGCPIRSHASRWRGTVLPPGPSHGSEVSVGTASEARPSVPLPPYFPLSVCWWSRATQGPHPVSGPGRSRRAGQEGSIPPCTPEPWVCLPIPWKFPVCLPRVYHAGGLWEAWMSAARQPFPRVYREPSP